MFKLSVKALGELRLEDFCPRCFWLKYHYPIEDRHPHYIHFPRIFTDIDSYIKNIIKLAFEGYGLFSWLRSLKETYNIVGVKKSKKFTTQLGQIILTGQPDMIFRLEDGEVFIVDFKTAKFTETQEKLFPLYEVQLNGYAILAERNGLNVKHLALIYFEPITNSEHPSYKPELNEECLILSFDFKVKEVEKWDKEEFIELVREAESILSEKEPPEGLTDCPKCVEFNNWMRRIWEKMG